MFGGQLRRLTCWKSCQPDVSWRNDVFASIYGQGELTADRRLVPAVIVRLSGNTLISAAGTPHAVVMIVVLTSIIDAAIIH